MNKLISISILLLSLNLYGADKPIILADGSIHSFTGLEGWGKKEGVNIIIDITPYIDKNFNKKAITYQIGLQLRLAGIRVGDKHAGEALIIRIQPVSESRLIGYAITIRPVRKMTFKYNEKEYTCLAGFQRGYNGITGLKGYRPFIELLMKQFLLDYLKANPKKENK
jgi:hypothetical protein